MRMVTAMLRRRPQRSASMPKTTPPSAPPAMNAASPTLAKSSRQPSNPADRSRSGSASFMQAPKICPSKTSNTHPAEATASTNHW